MSRHSPSKLGRGSRCRFASEKERDETLGGRQDGSIAHVADGRNVYPYERNPADPGGRWACILPNGERLEPAAEHDSREQPLLDDLQEKTSDAKPGTGAPENKNK